MKVCDRLKLIYCPIYLHINLFYYCYCFITVTTENLDLQIPSSSHPFCISHYVKLCSRNYPA